MEGLFTIFMFCWTYVGLQEAISKPIDWSLPYRGIINVFYSDMLYRALRIAGVISLPLSLQIGIWRTFIFFGAAWILRKVVLYFEYYRD